MPLVVDRGVARSERQNATRKAVRVIDIIFVYIRPMDSEPRSINLIKAKLAQQIPKGTATIFRHSRTRQPKVDLIH
jgi:hypothetical protein